MKVQRQHSNVDYAKLLGNAVKDLDNPNESYVKCLETITQIYDDCFPKIKLKIKSNNKANPWTTRGIAKSSKRKQKLYEKFLKNCSIQNEKIYKDYRKIFQTITMKSKRKYYSEKLLQFQGDAKKTWRIMKEVIGKSKLIHSTLPRKIVINKNVIFEEKHITNAFNNFFLNIGPKLADDIPTATRSFESYVQSTNETINEKPITINELKDAFFPLKIDKSAGYDEISFNVIGKRYFPRPYEDCKGNTSF